MDSINNILLCLYAPFALAVLWVVGCLFFRRTDLVPGFIARWLKGNSNSPRSMGGKKRAL